MKGVGTKAKVHGLFPDDGNSPSGPFGDGLAYRKAEEAAYRRYQAAQWLRKMDQGASESLSSNPSEEEFCLALRNGLTLCNVLKQVNPGAVSKGGMSSKVVDCILCLKGYHEWRQDGGVGIWRYGGTVKSPITVKGSTAFSTCHDGSSIPEPLHSINLSFCCAGTIRVYCRARPFLSGQHYGQSIVDYIGENGEIMIVNPDKPGKDARKMFSFNKVFGVNATQGMHLINHFSAYYCICCVSFNSVLILHVQGSELSSGSTLRGRLYLVDLAGSERVDKSEAVGERLKEAQHINKSLSALADVISALGQKNTHIPYRNSKLTQLLQDSLGGQAKTLMFVHINPHATAYKETISTLKFAERVSCVELGAARSNKESSQVRELKEEISNLMSTLRNKETELEQMKGGKIDQSAGRIEKTEIDFSTTSIQVPKNYINRRSQIGQPPQDETGSLENKTMLWTSCTSPTREWNSFPSAHSDRKLNQNLPSAKGESGANSKSSKLESPPQSRSLSVDYSKHRKSRMKGDVSDNQDEKPLQYPSGACLNRSISFTEKYAPEGCITLGNHKQDKLSSIISQHSGTNLQKFCPDHEKEQFRQVLNVTRGAIRKKKAQVKIGQKFQMAPHLQRSAIEQSGIQNDSRVAQNRKSGSSEPENRQGFSKTLLSNAPRPRKLFQSMQESRISHDLSSG
ncbi:Kinesin-related protein 8 [Nymphaea thermarum]|nr:Kinesin-related protein 8 [Nymphaea thermarum]